MTTVLDSIIDGVREDLAVRKAEVSLANLERRITDVAPAIQATEILRNARFNVIAEVKRSSPSKGALAEIAQPQDLARQYEAGGAAVVSVLTEQRRFSGSLADLDLVRNHIEIPILRKDFMVTDYQIFEARAHGADVILLIVAGLTQSQLRDFNQIALGLGMSVLVEVHDEAELDRAMDIEAALIGVNARNLKTLEVDLAVCHRIIPQIPSHVVAVAESGISSHGEVEKLARIGADAILVGEALVKGGHPEQTVREWIEIGREHKSLDGVR
ncbi:MAG: indole-3-glycerol phosphate synthase TrpC [Actinomycetales bacterium]|nr:indole-3-glycerol phosphate synthase TrpC [Actinomycetales bacterium]